MFNYNKQKCSKTSKSLLNKLIPEMADLEIKCTKKDISSCSRLAYLYLMKNNVDKVLSLSSLICSRKSHSGCGVYGYALYATAKYKDSVWALSKACLKSDVSSCLKAAAVSRDHLNDQNQAYQFYQKACEFDQRHGCSALGEYLLTEKKDIEGARPYLSSSCEKYIHPVACYNYACLFTRKKQFKEAFKRMRLAITYGFNRLEEFAVDPDFIEFRNTKFYRLLNDYINAFKIINEVSRKTDLYRKKHKHIIGAVDKLNKKKYPSNYLKVSKLNKDATKNIGEMLQIYLKACAYNNAKGCAPFAEVTFLENTDHVDKQRKSLAVSCNKNRNAIACYNYGYYLAQRKLFYDALIAMYTALFYGFDRYEIFATHPDLEVFRNTKYYTFLNEYINAIKIVNRVNVKAELIEDRNAK